MPTSCAMPYKDRSRMSASTQLRYVIARPRDVPLARQHRLQFVESVAGLLIRRYFGKLFEDGRDHLTRATPRCPEVDEDRRLAVNL